MCSFINLTIPLPLLITHVETTSAPVSDDAMTATIHAELDRKALLPAEHLVDTGYVDAKLLVESQRDYQLELVGPTRKNYHWQATQHTGFDADHFLIDWERQQATCPEGHTSSSWTPAIDNRTNEVIKIRVLDHRLPGMPVSISLYTIKLPYAQDGDDPSTGTICCLDAEAKAGTDQGICPGLCQASRS